MVGLGALGALVPAAVAVRVTARGADVRVRHIATDGPGNARHLDGEGNLPLRAHVDADLVLKHDVAKDAVVGGH